MDLYYEVRGNGAPVVLLHSGGADLRDWTLVQPLLAEKFKVIAFDGRGAGKSPAPMEPANYVEDLLNLLNHLQIDQTVLIGHSMGGQIATDFALEYPGRVSKLVLIAPSLSGFQPSHEMTEWMQRINAAAPDVEKMIELSFDAPSYAVIKSSPQWGLAYQMFKHHLQKTKEWGTFESIWPKPPALNRLEELAVKTLFVMGEEELTDNKRVADCFRKGSDIQFIEIPDADHMVTLTHPDILTRHITSFLEETHHAPYTRGK